MTDAKRNRNLGATSLRKRQRQADPMKTYDSLPAPLRYWLAQAALPWSPASAKRVWSRVLAKGDSVEVALKTLAAVETKTLARDTKSTIHLIESPD